MQRNGKGASRRDHLAQRAEAIHPPAARPDEVGAIGASSDRASGRGRGLPALAFEAAGDQRAFLIDVTEIDLPEAVLRDPGQATGQSTYPAGRGRCSRPILVAANSNKAPVTAEDPSLPDRVSSIGPTVEPQTGGQDGETSSTSRCTGPGLPRARRRSSVRQKPQYLEQGHGGVCRLRSMQVSCNELRRKADNPPSSASGTESSTGHVIPSSCST